MRGILKITAVKPQNDRTGKYSVIFEDGAEIIVSAACIAEFGICPGYELSEVGCGELLDRAALDASKARALRILGNRSLSAREMEVRLIGKGESAETARRTVEWLEDIGMVNDCEYAGMIARHYIAKGYGIARVKNEFFKRGIQRELWEEALNDLSGMEEASYNFIAKRLKGECGKDELRHAANALIARGFSYEEARAAVNRYLEGVGESKDYEL